MRLRRIAAGCLVAAVLTGCSYGGDGAPGRPADDGTASGQREVDVTLQFRESGRVYRLAFKLRVKLGEPIDRQNVCELVEPERTVSVPVTITLVNTHHKDYRKHEQGGQRWWEPNWLGAEPVGATRGSLAWVPNSSTPRPGCAPDLGARTIGKGWDTGEDIVIHGYLSGVPEDDRSGVGVRIFPVKTGEEASWDVEGDAKPLTVTY